MILTIYGLPYDHRPWSAFGDAEMIRPYNPLTRVPTLVLDDGTALTDSHVILGYLDRLMPPERVLVPQTARAARVIGLACGAADAGVSLFYEQRLHQSASEVLVARRRGQIAGACAALEDEQAGRAGDFLYEDRITHADIAVAAALRFLNEAHPGVVPPFPRLTDHAERLEALAPFQAIQQPFVAPA
jgi:glutathione S-transferase